MPFHQSQLGIEIRHARTLHLIFSRSSLVDAKWSDIEVPLGEPGAKIEEAEGSKVAEVLFGQVRGFHRRHPGPNTGKPGTSQSAVASARKWLENNTVKP